MDKLIGVEMLSKKEHEQDISLFFNQQAITYSKFKINVARIQNQLLNLSKDKKTTVGIHLANEPFFLEVYFAIITLGWTAVPLSIASSEEVLNYKIKKSELTLLVTDTKLKKHKQLIQVNQTDLLNTSEDNQDLHLRAKEDDLFYLGFTSGSTGNPKAFVRTQASWIESFKVAEKVFNLTPHDCFMAPGPLAHSLSLFAATHALHLRAKLFLTDKFNPKEVRDAIHTGKATVVYLVPTMINALVKQEKTDRKVSFLSSGAKLSNKLMEELKGVFPNASLYEYYGASELSFVSYTTESLRKIQPNSVGKPFPNVEITIKDKKVHVNSPYVFSHYLNDPDATQKVKTSIGINIGDLGYLKDGLLTLIGRENNLIITGGVNVYPEEVEKLLKTLPTIKELMITSVPSNYWGEKIIALVEWHCEPDLDSVKQLSKQLPIEMRPRRYYKVSNLPYTDTRKLARHEINRDLARWINA